MKKKNKQVGWCIIVYGFSGAGKTAISKKIKKKIEKIIGKTILIDGDELRIFFSKIGINFGYTKKERNKSVIPKLELLNLILNQNINIIYPTIFLNKLAINKWSKNIENLVKVHIKTDINEIIKFGIKKEFYTKNKNIVGKDIKAIFPKKPLITIENNFKKNIDTLANETFTKIKNKLNN